jgi:hypothetical protein
MERLLRREGTLHLGRLQTLLAEGSACQDDAGNRGHSAGEEAGAECQHGDLLPGTNILQGIQADGRYSRCAGRGVGARTTPASFLTVAAKVNKHALSEVKAWLGGRVGGIYPAWGIM